MQGCNVINHPARVGLLMHARDAYLNLAYLVYWDPSVVKIVGRHSLNYPPSSLRSLVYLPCKKS